MPRVSYSMPGESSSKTDVILISTIAATATLIVVIGVVILMVVLIRRRRNRTSRMENTLPGDHGFDNDVDYDSIHDTGVMDDDYESISQLERGATTQGDDPYVSTEDAMRTLPLQDRIDSERIPIKRLKEFVQDIRLGHLSLKSDLESMPISRAQALYANQPELRDQQRFQNILPCPLDRTVDSFWRMVWEQKIHCIAMLSKLFEKDQNVSEKYWPDTEDTYKSYGGIQVKINKETHWMDFIQRTMTVKKDRVPLHAIGVLKLLSKVVQLSKYFLSSVLVHCSSGSGRTGTFIALHHLIEELETSDGVNVFDRVLSLRLSRTLMVQSVEQYHFLHQAALEALTLGTAGISFPNATISRTALHSHASYLTEQIQGFRSQSSYIVTQWPLEETMVDFWRLVMDYRVKDVFLLEQASVKSGFPSFFESQSLKYGNLSVKCDHVCREKGSVYCDFHIQRQINDTHPLQFDEHKSTLHTIGGYSPIETVIAMQRIIQQSDSVAVLVCSDGAACCGWYAAAFNIMDNYDDQYEIDVFYMVHQIKSIRPEFVTLKDQLHKLHKFGKEYVKHQKKLKLENNTMSSSGIGSVSTLSIDEVF
ncbi:hypothetical protein CAPTEDRAFT_190735 [Capitella teleta]|uniref:Protein-tyrosine-phosphatase n=1 Tax=Capitella teleta TaxID=283909 RepID=R7TET1_CAPTE|nr:hypothetical protein CAPTEDRAFT_190735 [Capitella teleta]|eukprot:ELT91992.1 hypothetical protein CAPTEDRAFT_190735 [Capitella teleta]